MYLAEFSTKDLKNTYHGIALFSGGLDSILAIKILEEQGLDVLGVHFVSPFFGNREKIPFWEEEYQIDILAVDVGESYIDIIKNPRYGHGKGLNPCIDCKIFMLKKAKELLEIFNAKFIVTGEVIGQRPMSQRKDTMDIIARDSNSKDILIRPLCAKNLSPTKVELENIVDRSKLLNLRGRSRKSQLELAKKYNIKNIPTPAGGCLLTDHAMVKRYKMILGNLKFPTLEDFSMARMGRHFWSENFWLIIGRNHEENIKLLKLIKPHDLIFKLSDIPGPIGIGRGDKKWPQELIHSAGRLIAWYSKARMSKRPVKLQVASTNNVQQVEIFPDIKNSLWTGPI